MQPPSSIAVPAIATTMRLLMLITVLLVATLK
jgi:hypothetical protein